MTATKITDLASFKKKLDAGEYAEGSAARKSLGRLPLTEDDKTKARTLIDKKFGAAVRTKRAAAASTASAPRTAKAPAAKKGSKKAAAPKAAAPKATKAAAKPAAKAAKSAAKGSKKPAAKRAAAKKGT